MGDSYEIRLQGYLDCRWSEWLGDGLTLTHREDGTTVLAGLVADQAALHGLLTKVRDLGLTLLSVHLTLPKAKVDHTESDSR